MLLLQLEDPLEIILPVLGFLSRRIHRCLQQSEKIEEKRKISTIPSIKIGGCFKKPDKTRYYSFFIYFSACGRLLCRMRPTVSR